MTWHLAYQAPTGKLILGYGHNLDEYPIEGLHKHSRLSETEAFFVLCKDMERVCKQVLAEIPFSEELDPARFAVLVNMAFDLGIRKLKEFKKILRFTENGEYTDAAIEILKSEWATQVVMRAKELAEQMHKGQWVACRAQKVVRNHTRAPARTSIKS